MTVPFKIQAKIQEKLQGAFSPTKLEVINESHNHSVPKGSETHFKVVIVSFAFEGKSLVQRHRAVYQVLSEELSNGVHALALHTKTPIEEGSAPDSPPCASR